MRSKPALLIGTLARTGQFTVNKEAAGRFIKHAIAQAKNVRLVDETEQDTESSAAGPSTSAKRVPIKTTAKMHQRAEYEKNLKEIADEEEDDLEVFGENVEEDYPMDEPPADVSLGMEDEGKEREEQVADAPGSRRKRPRIDPFAGMLLFCFTFFVDPCSLQVTTYRLRSLQFLVENQNLCWLKPTRNAARQRHRPLMNPSRQNHPRKDLSVRQRNNNKHRHSFVHVLMIHLIDTLVIKQKARDRPSIQ